MLINESKEYSSKNIVDNKNTMND